MRATQICNEIDGGIHEKKEKETVVFHNFHGIILSLAIAPSLY
jgi:hypothetical protein